jgi:hypothetical protein
MRKGWSYVVALLTVMLIASCQGNLDPSKIFPQSTFDKPFPKKNVDLSKILGDQLIVELEKDTFTLRVTSTKEQNIIVDEKDRDTVFIGTVSHFRGMYYFSHRINDTAYWIFAVKLRDKLIYGLNGALRETFCIDKQIKSGDFKEMVKYIDTVKKSIRLRTDKKGIRTMLAKVMDTIKADTILVTTRNKQQPAKVDTTAITAQVDPEDYEFLDKVYPNPATDELNVELQEQADVTYYISDITGKSLTKGEFKEVDNKIDVSKLPAGIYVLTLLSADNKKEESVKVVKQ